MTCFDRNREDMKEVCRHIEGQSVAGPVVREHENKNAAHRCTKQKYIFFLTFSWISQSEFTSFHHTNPKQHILNIYKYQFGLSFTDHEMCNQTTTMLKNDNDREEKQPLWCCNPEMMRWWGGHEVAFVCLGSCCLVWTCLMWVPPLISYQLVYKCPVVDFAVCSAARVDGSHAILNAWFLNSLCVTSLLKLFFIFFLAVLGLSMLPSG